MCTQSVSHVQVFGTPWTIAHQASLSIGFLRQEHWGGVPFPSPGDVPHRDQTQVSSTVQYFSFSFWQCFLWDLSFLTRDWTWGRSSESSESWPLGHRELPSTAEGVWHDELTYRHHEMYIHKFSEHPPSSYWSKIKKKKEKQYFCIREELLGFTPLIVFMDDRAGLIVCTVLRIPFLVFVYLLSGCSCLLTTFIQFLLPLPTSVNTNLTSFSTLLFCFWSITDLQHDVSSCYATFALCACSVVSDSLWPPGL